METFVHWLSDCGFWKSKWYSLNRIISFWYMLMTSSRRAGACSRRHSIRIVGDARLYNLKKVGFSAKKKQKNQPWFTDLLNLKVFCLLFYQKKGWFFPQRKSRKTNLLKIFLTQKFFAYFFTKRKVGFFRKEKAERPTLIYWFT